MALLIPARTAQYPLVASFTFNFDDTMANTSGTVINFETSGAVDAIPLPAGAIVTGGEIFVETAYNTTGAATLSVGDADSATRYLGATSIKSTGRTALVPTGYRSVGKDVRLTLSVADTAGTAGKVTVNVQYILEGRANENNL